MTVESFLTRELQVRFIDARKLATQARLNLGVKGYPGKSQEQDIIDEAIHLFQQRSEKDQDTMRQINTNLNMAKMTKVQRRSLLDSTSDTETSSSVCDTESRCGSIIEFDTNAPPKRKFKFWTTQRR